MNQNEHQKLEVSQRVFGKNYEYFDNVNFPWQVEKETKTGYILVKKVGDSKWYQTKDKTWFIPFHKLFSTIQRIMICLERTPVKRLYPHGRADFTKIYHKLYNIFK